MTSTVAAPVRRRSDAQVISYLAFTGMLLALGIDVALPAFDEMRPDLGVAPGSSRITLILTTYFLGMGIGQLVWGPVSDRFGRQGSMLAGVAVYVACSLAAAMAPSLTFMLAVRFVWGVAAAAPTGLRPAIARDLYTGDQMARVMSLVMAIFMIGPIIAPIAGELILQVASWPWVFVVCGAAGLAQMAWTVRFGETLPAERRQPLQFKATVAAFRTVLTTRQTIAFTLALGFAYSSFYVFLASTQPIMDNIYGREPQFAWVFGGSGVLMAGAFTTANMLFKRLGSAAAVRLSTAAFVVAGVLQVCVALAGDGVPSFWLWIGVVILANLVSAPITPASFTLGLEPLGDLAGTAAGVMGFLSIIIGSVFSAAVNSRIDDSVTPMALAYAGFGALSLLAVLSSRAHADST